MTSQKKNTEPDHEEASVGFASIISVPRRTLSDPTRSYSTAVPRSHGEPHFRSVSGPTFGREPEFRHVDVGTTGIFGVVQDNIGYESKSTDYMEAFHGWSDNVNPDYVRLLPEYFPSQKMISRNSMPMKLLPEVLKRLQKCIRSESIQALYTDQPLEAKLQTLENCELYLDFWKSSSGNDFYIHISRRRGDHFIAYMYINKLLNAAMGFGQSDTPSEQQFDSSQVQSYESFLNEAIANSGYTDGNQPSTQEAEKVIMQTIHASIMSNRLDDRTRGLKQLVLLTDLKRTMSHAACSASLVVLSGRAKDHELAEKALDIHEAIMRLLFEKEFLGDDEIFVMDDDDDMDLDDLLDAEPFFPTPTLERNRPRYYEENMNELHHMALTILTQALEVATTFDTELSQDIRDFCEKYVTLGLDKLLIEYIAKVTSPAMESQSLSKGYLACKALRIMASSDRFLRNRVLKDSLAKQRIIGAANVGKYRHAMLENESNLLWSTVCS